MPTIKIDGVTYTTRSDDLNRTQIQHPTTKKWHLLKVYAITRDQDDDVYVMPVKAYLNPYKTGQVPSFLGALPNVMGGNVDYSDTATKTLVKELEQETHGQYAPGAKDSLIFLNILFIPVYCYAFYSCDVVKTGTSIPPTTKAMQEMTGEHLRFSAQALMDEINRVRLTDQPTKTEIKTAILRLYGSTTLPQTLRSYCINTLSIDAQDYDNQLIANTNTFENNAHTMEALAEFLQSKITPLMIDNKRVVLEQRELERLELERLEQERLEYQERQQALEERQARQRRAQMRQFVALSLFLIVILFGVFLGNVDLFGGA